MLSFKQLSHLPSCKRWIVVLLSGLALALGSLQPAAGATLPLNIDEPAGVDRTAYPITQGIPFPEGRLRSAEHIRVLDPAGREVPSQVRALSYWLDGSIRWLLVDFQSDVEANATRTYWLEYGSKVQALPVTNPLQVSENAEHILIDTGPLRLTISKTRGTIIETAWLDLDGNSRFSPDEQLMEPDAQRGSFVVVDRCERREKQEVPADKLRVVDTVLYRSDLLQAAPIEVVVEEAGPLRATVLIKGMHRGEKWRSGKFAPYEVRLQAFRGLSVVRIYHTFTYTGDPYRDYIKALGLTFHFRLESPSRVAVGTEAVWEGAAQGLSEVALLQSTPQQFTVGTKNHMGASQVVTRGQEAQGWIDLTGSNFGVSIMIRNFWQEAPKGIKASLADGRLTAYLYPPQVTRMDLRRNDHSKAGNIMELGEATGIAKTHELALYFHPAEVAVNQIAGRMRAFSRPSIAYVTPEWYRDTGVFGRFHPYDPERFPRVEGKLRLMLEWVLFSQRDDGWYGMWDYGDIKEQFDHKRLHWIMRGRTGWLNNELYQTHAFLLHFLRTGDRRFHDLFEAMARHIMDVDVNHVGPRRGEFRRHNVQHWGDNHPAGHEWVKGILEYYYIAGYQRGLEVAKEIGESVIQRHFSRTDRFTGGGRSTAAPLRIMVNLWQATGEERYRQYIEKLIDIILASRTYDGLPSGHFVYKYNEPEGQRFAIKSPRPSVLGFHVGGYEVPAFTDYYLYTKDDRAKEMLIAIAERALVPFYHHKGYADSTMHNTFAIGYWLTGNRGMLEAALENLRQWGMVHGSVPNVPDDATRAQWVAALNWGPLPMRSLKYMALELKSVPYILAAFADAGIDPGAFPVSEDPYWYFYMGSGNGPLKVYINDLQDWPFRVVTGSDIEFQFIGPSGKPLEVQSRALREKEKLIRYDILSDGHKGVYVGVHKGGFRRAELSVTAPQWVFEIPSNGLRFDTWRGNKFYFFVPKESERFTVQVSNKNARVLVIGPDWTIRKTLKSISNTTLITEEIAPRPEDRGKLWGLYIQSQDDGIVFNLLGVPPYLAIYESMFFIPEKGAQGINAWIPSN